MRHSLILSTLFLLNLLTFSSSVFAQRNTNVKGVILDKTTGEQLSFVNISFKGTTIGTTSELDGSYELETKEFVDSLVVSYLGYETQTIAIKLGTKQVIDISMNTEALSLNTVTVEAKKQRYRKRDNPAVDLINEVVNRKDKNRYTSQEFYQCGKYEKLEIDLTNIDEAFKKNRMLRKIDFIFDYVDTSELTGKTFLPLFLKESISEVYYRKSPTVEKENLKGVNITGFKEVVDDKTLGILSNALYQDINIYSPNIMMMGFQFISPTHPLGPSLYKYYIIDTLEYEGRSVIDLAFYPQDKQALAYIGNMYITNDTTYAIVKVDLSVSEDINLNFVKEIAIKQEFEQTKEGPWVLKKDETTIDFGLFEREKSKGFMGTRKVSYNNHTFGVQASDTIYNYATKIIEDPKTYIRKDAFWETARHKPLSDKEKQVYVMVDSLKEAPVIKRAVNVLMFFFGGYTDIGPFDVGPVGTFFSYNAVEGLRLRLGFQTRVEALPKLKIEGYGAYGLRDRAWKYSLGAKYSFNNTWRDNPRHEIGFRYQHETNFLSQAVQFKAEDSFLLSFRRGNTARMLFNDLFEFRYQKEFISNFSVEMRAGHRTMRPLGDLSFLVTDPEGNQNNIPNITNATFDFRLRYAPNEQFLQGFTNRTSFTRNKPVFTLDYQLGAKGVLGSQYDYHKVIFNFTKRFYMSFLGYGNFTFEAGKIFGDGLAYPILYVPPANQSYSYFLESFNMMNFLEFTADQYIEWNYQHFFNGLLFNRLPLLKKLKLREVASFKGVYGSLNDGNNPMKHPELIQFPLDQQGRDIVYSLDQKPYMEVSAGLANILKFGRLDFVQRINYLDNPNVPTLFGVKGLGLRFRASVEF